MADILKGKEGLFEDFVSPVTSFCARIYKTIAIATTATSNIIAKIVKNKVRPM